MKGDFKLFFILIVSFLMASCRGPKSAASPSVELKGSTSFPRTDSFMEGLLGRYPQYFDSVLGHREEYRVQIIYTRIDRKAHNKPIFTNYYYNVDPRRYFYPASTVKMPTAALALERLHQLKIRGLDRQTTMVTEAGYSGQTQTYNDPTTPDGRPTVEQYIRKIFLVSDNEAFNRLYEFLGQSYINQTLHRMGYDSTQILHRLNISLSEEENRYTNPVKFFDSSGKLVYEKGLLRSDMIYQLRHDVLGSGYLKNDQIVHQPFDFSKKNRLTLVDLHSIFRSLLFPRSVPRSQRFRINKEDYPFLYKHMSMSPRESLFPSYDTSYTDGYSKFFLYGGHGDFKPGLRIFNKEGDAYGFLNDIAYIVDYDHGVEFFLSATIYCDRDGIVNDDHYDYETVGYPFLKHLGEVFYQYELARKKKHLPDLSGFKMDYRQ